MVCRCCNIFPTNKRICVIFYLRYIFSNDNLLCNAILVIYFVLNGFLSGLHFVRYRLYIQSNGLHIYIFYRSFCVMALYIDLCIVFSIIEHFSLHYCFLCSSLGVIAVCRSFVSVHFLYFAWCFIVNSLYSFSILFLRNFVLIYISFNTLFDQNFHQIKNTKKNTIQENIKLNHRSNLSTTKKEQKHKCYQCFFRWFYRLIAPILSNSGAQKNRFNAHHTNFARFKFRF